jgi:hypothetical protein
MLATVAAGVHQVLAADLCRLDTPGLLPSKRYLCVTSEHCWSRCMLCSMLSTAHYLMILLQNKYISLQVRHKEDEAAQQSHRQHISQQ